MAAKMQKGNCRYCKRRGINVYNQRKKAHNRECNPCHTLYRKILIFANQRASPGTGTKAIARGLGIISGVIPSGKIASECEIDSGSKAINLIGINLSEHPVCVGNVDYALSEIIRIVHEGIV